MPDRPRLGAAPPGSCPDPGSDSQCRLRSPAPSAEAGGLPYVLFEIRQDHLDSEAGIERWATRLGALLSEAFEHPSLDRVAPLATDVCEWRYHQAENQP